MKKLLTAAFCLSIIAFGTQNVMAKDNFDKMPPKPPKMEGQKRPMPKLEDKLNLTDAQKAQAKANRIQGRKEMKPIMDQIRVKKEEIMDIVDSDLPEAEQKAKIKAIHEDLKVLRKQANAVREKNMANFEKILTKEQKAEFAKMKAKKNPNGCKACAKRMPPPPIED